MGRLIVLLAVMTLAIFFWLWFRREYREKGRPFAVKTLLVGVALALLILAGTGRIHWVGAALASLLAALRFALPLLLRSLPFLQRWHTQNRAQSSQHYHGQDSQTDTSENISANVSTKEALAILGLKENPSEAEVIDAHRRLIQKLHPDRGGNAYLAARVNRAKDVLLEQV